MTKLVVDIGALSKFSTVLGDDAVEFDSITNRMDEIVRALRAGWTGVDATKFINNATAYIDDLKIVRQALVDSSNAIVGQVGSYNRRLEEFHRNMEDKKYE